LSWDLVLIVLAGAVLHAGWNALVKSSGDKEIDTALVHFMGALVALPLLAMIGLPPLSAAPYIAASLVVHIGYYIALAGAYKHGDLGLTYPIMRGTAPLLVALSSGLVLGEAPTPLAWAGILGITGGVALVGLSHPGDALHHRKALAYALANALIIAVYTMIDGKGVRGTVAAGQSAASYVTVMFVLDGLPYPTLVWARRSASGRRAILDYARQRWPLATLGGAASIGSYTIALWAMTRAPVASVAALRETSVLFAAVLGTLLLKERFGLQRALGTGVIVGGVMALRLA
jgi:phosphonate utilization associated putative membrane protein